MLPKLYEPGAAIYMFHCVGTEYYKIGSTNNLDYRLKAVQTSNPHKIVLFTSISTILPRSKIIKWEKKLHKKFATFHIRGEWFIFSKATAKDAKKIFKEVLRPMKYQDNLRICVDETGLGW